MIVGWRCAVCATTVDVAAVHPFRCPRATAADPHHVLHPLEVGPLAAPLEDPNPFVDFGPRLAWWAFARTHGMTEAACVALTRTLADGFTVTPFAQSPLVSSAIGANVWVKDETGNVGGSHKGRHLVTILLHLVAAESLGLVARSTRPPLAIASCGNAAIAAATLAARAEWPLDVFVPTWAGPEVLGLLEELGATIHPCPRRDDDPPGDPAVLRFREAVAAGAVPFSVQGPENALCLDGGRTIGWEMAAVELDRALVQVGGGALATCTGWGLGAGVRLDAVQTAGCAPLARALERAVADPGASWSAVMTPWVDPHSAADGILDDETYDWLGVRDVLVRSGGRAIVAPEAAIVQAHELGVQTGIPVSATGTRRPGRPPDPRRRPDRPRRARRRHLQRHPALTPIRVFRCIGVFRAGGPRTKPSDDSRRPDVQPTGNLDPMSEIVLPHMLDAGIDPRADIFNRLLRNRVIMLGAAVDDDIANQVCAQLLYLEGDDDKKDIWLYINSPGGSVTAGMAIYDTMQFVGCDVATVCLGLAASMGQFLLTAGAAGKRYTLPNARIMMHQPLAGLRGQASDIAIQAEQHAYTKRRMAELIAFHSGKSLEQIQADSERDRWFTAEQAVEYGLCDEVKTRRGEIAAVV